MSVNLRTIYAFAREMYPKTSQEYIQYGTAGFRGKAINLDSCMFRMGVLATLRSRNLGGDIIGVMVTASHNPEPDNGVKLIDPKGEMLDSSWEAIATSLANVNDNDLEEEVQRIILNNNINISSPSNVYVGMDTRYHSPRLLKAVADGVIALKGNVREFGIVSTPMMHYFVVASNTKGSYGQPTEEGYYKKYITAFEKLFNINNKKNYNRKILFDGANGVGASKMLQFIKRMNGLLDIDVLNRGEGKINHECGADYVKVNHCLPTALMNVEPYHRCVSVDGDADRLVYYFIDESRHFHLLDGDRIAILIASYLSELLKNCNLSLNLGIVQTAYANGASTKYIKDSLKLPVVCVPTGVKHLHHKAMDFDIGVYFEANGHGTVLFSENAKNQISNLQEKNEFTGILQNIIDLINETVGDAISDMLLVEVILNKTDMDVKEWLATYEDLPNIQKKVEIPDRTIITTTDAERICVTPIGLQDEINKTVAKFRQARAFVRPSGTENVVRVYAEAITTQEAYDLGSEVCALVKTKCGEINNHSILQAQNVIHHM